VQQAIISSNHFKQSFQAIISSNHYLYAGLPPNRGHQGILYSIRENHGERKMFQEIGKNHGSFQSRLVLLQGIEFFHTQSHIQLSVAIAKFHPFEYYSVFMQSL